MDRYFFMKAVLNRLSDGVFFRRNLALAIRVGAIVAAVWGLAGFVDAWNFTAHQDAGRMPGGILYMLLFAAAVYMAVHALLIRARDLASLPRTGFTAIPIGAVLSLVAGEAYSAVCAALAVGGGILIWFTGDAAYNLLHKVTFFLPAQGGETFMAGVLFIVRGAIRAVAALFLGSLASELFIVVEKLGGNARLGPAASE